MENELLDEIRGFEPWEASGITRDFVCAVCWSSLIAIQLDGDRTMIVVCPEHGNVELCGRITKNTVSIELENGARNYHKVIRILSDLWGHLADEPEFKCGKCGNHQVEVTKDDDYPNMYHIHCPKHPNVIQSVILKKVSENESNRRVN